MYSRNLFYLFKAANQLTIAVTPAWEGKNVFISTSATEKKILKMFPNESSSLVFIRAPVATGKSTLAYALSKNDKYVLVNAQSDRTEGGWKKAIVEAVRRIDKTLVDRPELYPRALKVVAEKKKVLIFDEAHLLFNCRNLTDALFKPPAEVARPNMLLISAASQGKREGEGPVEIIQTPAEIRDKLMWYPPLPLADDSLQKQLQSAGVKLSLEAIDFFFNICGHHRGIFMSVMTWVEEEQNATDIVFEAREEWSIVTAATRVRESMLPNGLLPAMCDSRAVKVNGPYTDLPSIPIEFVYLLCGEQISMSADTKRTLTIAGFIQPVSKESSSSSEFVKYDWNSADVKVGVANPNMAQYYSFELRNHFGLTTSLISQPANCLDMLLTALPSMTFANVVSFPTKGAGQEPQSPLSADGLPFEVQYTGAAVTAFKTVGIAAASHESPTLGKIDVYCQVGNETFSMEGIMATCDLRSHAEHRDRFDDKKKTNYSGATQKCVWTIGASEDTVIQRVNATRAEGVDIIGVHVSLHHQSYDVYWKPAASTYENPLAVVGPLRVQCNSVPQRYNPETKQLEPNQKFDSIARCGEWLKLSVWVKQEAAGHPPFCVAPQGNDIDALKKAIKAEMGTDYTGNAALLKISKQTAEGGCEAIKKQSTPLVANTEETPYVFELPS